MRGLFVFGDNAKKAPGNDSLAISLPVRRPARDRIGAPPPERRLKVLAAAAARVEETTRELKLKVLRRLIPICAWCKKIRDDGGDGNKLEAYVSTHTHATFTHGICPECAHKLDDDTGSRATLARLDRARDDLHVLSPRSTASRAAPRAP